MVALVPEIMNHNKSRFEQFLSQEVAYLNGDHRFIATFTEDSSWSLRLQAESISHFYTEFLLEFVVILSFHVNYVSQIGCSLFWKFSEG
jgi:hypothetical protein